MSLFVWRPEKIALHKCEVDEEVFLFKEVGARAGKCRVAAEVKNVTCNEMWKSNLRVRDWRERVRRHHWAVKSRMSLSPSHKRWTSAPKLSLKSSKKPASKGVTVFTQTCTCICVYVCIYVSMLSIQWQAMSNFARKHQGFLKVFLYANVTLTHIILAWLGLNAPLSTLACPHATENSS